MPQFAAFWPATVAGGVGYGAVEGVEAVTDAMTPKMPDIATASEAPDMDTARLKAQEDVQRRRAKLSRTILSSPQGDLSPSGANKRSLLGG